MDGQLLFLGTGSSLGVPVIGCRCSTCKSQNSKDKRERSSVLLRIQGKNILIDPGPDLRQKVLAYDINSLDAVIITHAHYDHIGGLDELRAYFYQNTQKLPIFLLEETFCAIKHLHVHLFSDSGERDESPFFVWHRLQRTRKPATFLLNELLFSYVTFTQHGMDVMGIRLGNLAYLSDIKEYAEDIFSSLSGVDTLVISAARETESSMHFSVDEAVAFARTITPQPKAVYITHIAHEILHEKVEKTLPTCFFLAYDGLELSFRS